jgi:hypothetical protein
MRCATYCSHLQRTLGAVRADSERAALRGGRQRARARQGGGAEGSSRSPARRVALMEVCRHDPWLERAGVRIGISEVEGCAMRVPGGSDGATSEM